MKWMEVKERFGLLPKKDASRENIGRSLTQADPPPQTVYRFQTKPNVPIMVNFALIVKKQIK